MRCPRCGGTLATFALEGKEKRAMVCETCGFAGIPASHRPEGESVESWDQVVERFDGTSLPPARTDRTDRVGNVPSASDTDAAIDPDRLEETVTVGTSLLDQNGHEADGSQDPTENRDERGEANSEAQA